MSALGQKQTCAVQTLMSALLPITTAKADLARRHGYALSSRYSAATAGTMPMALLFGGVLPMRV